MRARRFYAVTTRAIGLTRAVPRRNAHDALTPFYRVHHRLKVITRVISPFWIILQVLVSEPLLYDVPCGYPVSLPRFDIHHLLVDSELSLQLVN